MIPHNFIDILKDKVTSAITEESKRLAKGMAEDWGGYKERCGIIKGLGMLESFIDEIRDDKEKR